MKVQKRNGKIVNFDITRVENAVKKAFKSSNIKITEDIINSIDDSFNNLDNGDDKPIQIELIQDRIEQKLYQLGYPQVAKSFIIYREKRREVRDWTEEKMKFIDKYKRSSNTANATVDDNSNVANKNIGILNSEIHKADNILISRRMISEKLKELFPDFDYKQYERDLDSHIIYKHDESSFAGAIAPYTYSPSEVVEVKYGENHWLVSLETLYDLVDIEEKLLDKDQEVYGKFPKELFIKDKDGYVNVSRLIKKKRHRDLVEVSTESGEDIVVTDNHPLIVSGDIDKTVDAVDSMGLNQLVCKPNLVFGNIDKIDLSKVIKDVDVYDTYITIDGKESSKRFIDIDSKLGYFIGHFLGIGGIQGDNVYIFSYKEEIVNKISEYVKDIFGIESIISKKVSTVYFYSLTIPSKIVVSFIKDYLKITNKDYIFGTFDLQLPVNILEFNESFSKGIIEGFSELSEKDNTIHHPSRTLINQLTILLKYFGYNVSNRYISSDIYSQIGAGMAIIWEVIINDKEENTNEENSWSKIVSVKKIENSDYLNRCDYIYDITTESSTFLTSNILVHNCCSITMYPFLLGGIKGIGGLSAKPKNLDSFCGMYINLIFATSAMFAGACMYKDQTLFISKDGNIEKITSKDLITNYFDSNKDKVRKFTNWQGDWEYINVEDLDLKVYEDGSFIKINKLYRRRYNNSIYRVSTEDGFTATVSKDHIFKQSINELSLEISAENLKVGDSVVMNKNLPNGLEIDNINTEDEWFSKLGKDSSIDVISSITTFENDDDYVYEIETETHWYNCGGFITHNCATSEFLLYFDYFARKEWGDLYYQKPDIVITTPYCVRQKTIKSQIHQYFQQVIYSINQPAAARGLQSASIINLSCSHAAEIDI